MPRSLRAGRSPQPGAAPLEVALHTIAPIDDGTDAVETAERLLRAATLLPEVRLVSHFRGGQFAWRGRLADASLHGSTLELHGCDLFAKVDLAAVLAVSYCTDATSSGIRLYDESGAFLTLCSSCGDTFDAWLGGTLSEYACGVDRPDPNRLRGSLGVPTARTFPAP